MSSSDLLNICLNEQNILQSTDMESKNITSSWFSKAFSWLDSASSNILKSTEFASSDQALQAPLKQTDPVTTEDDGKADEIEDSAKTNSANWWKLQSDVWGNICDDLSTFVHTVQSDTQVMWNRAAGQLADMPAGKRLLKQVGTQLGILRENEKSVDKMAPIKGVSEFNAIVQSILAEQRNQTTDAGKTQVKVDFLLDNFSVIFDGEVLSMDDEEYLNDWMSRKLKEFHSLDDLVRQSAYCSEMECLLSRSKYLNELHQHQVPDLQSEGQFWSRYICMRERIDEEDEKRKKLFDYIDQMNCRAESVVSPDGWDEQDTDIENESKASVDGEQSTNRPSSPGFTEISSTDDVVIITRTGAYSSTDGLADNDNSLLSSAEDTADNCKNESEWDEW